MAEFKLFEPIQKELNLIDNEIMQVLDTDIQILWESSTHLLKAGGKKIRPAFVLLCARLYTDNLQKAVKMAAALELIHISSLVHDDVIDNSSVRRGQPTVKALWGNRASLYTGNYTLAKSLLLISEYEREDIVELIARASMLICEGEIRQMDSCYDVEQGMKSYLRRISRKTALLISLSCEIGGLICDAPAEQVKALKQYGYYLGMAFQITDDILDFVSDQEVLGKPVGSDIRQGVITLPAIYALRYSPRRERLGRILANEEARKEDIEEALEVIMDSGGIDYAYECSCKYVSLARRELDRLPETPVRENLAGISDYITDRKS